MRGEGRGVGMPEKAERLEIGKGRIIQQGSDIAILSLGTILEESEKAAMRLAEEGISVTLADARFAKPFDKALVRELVTSHKGVLIVEEGSPGGFSAHLLQYMANEGLLMQGCDIKVAQIADDYIDHDTRQGQLQKAGIDAASLVGYVRSMVSDKTKQTQIS